MTPDLLPLLFTNAIKATLLLTAAFAMNVLLQRSSAAARHLVWTAALACLLALPIVSAVLPGWQWRAIRHTAAAERTDLPVATSVQAVLPGSPAPASSPGRQAWIVAVWAAGAVVVLARLTAGTARISSVSRRARAIQESDTTRLLAQLAGEMSREERFALSMSARKQSFRSWFLERVRASVLLLESDEAQVPMTWGVFRPVILLPRAARAWSSERLRMVLAHELAHVKRRDCLTQAVVQIGCALYWFHPLVWIAVRRLQEERERACDDVVLARGTRASEYAEHLLELTRSLRSNGGRWSAAVAMAQASHLRNRLVAMFDSKRNRRALSRRSAVFASLAAACLVLPLATIRLSAQATGGLAGWVLDASGGRVPRAMVTVSNPELRRKEMVPTNEAGEFKLPGLPEGSYTLEVRKPGFALFERKGISIAANTQQFIPVMLKIGRVSEMVEVVGKAPRPATSRTGTPQRIRVGGNVQATKLLKATKPIYPDNAQQAGIEGTVLLEAVISKEGSLLGLKVLNTLVHPDLAAAAMAAVPDWQYQPTLLNGDPVEIVTTITVNFRLER